MAKAPTLPTHIEDTVQAIAKLHAEHYRRATVLQRAVDRMTAFIGRPRFVAGLTVFVSLWIGGNLLVLWNGGKPWDGPPFNLLQCAAGLTALYVAVLILTTQRREDELAAYREQLTLELAALSEQKTAKVIELVERLRLDDPRLLNRADPQAKEMSAPSDPHAVLQAIKEAHSDALGDVAPQASEQTE